MRIYSGKKSRLENLRHGCRKWTACRTGKDMNKWFRIYCENTSLQGFRYITANGSIIEGVFWSVVCASSIVFCVVLMLRLWGNYSKNPIATTIDTSNLIWNLPFPSVTICNNNKIHRPYADVIAKQLAEKGISSRESEQFFFSLLKLIRPGQVSIDNSTAQQILNILDMSVETLMNQLMQPCNELLVRCAWVGQLYDCNKIFKMVKSRDGFCCAFNNHYDLNDRFVNDRDEQSKIFNSTEFNDTVDYPPGVSDILNSPGSGRDVGLTVVLNIDRYSYKASIKASVGATIFVHDAIDFPDIGASITTVSPGHVMSISVTGTSIKSMDSMRSLPPETRSCYFDDEVSEKRYSFQSCVSECLAKQLQSVCNCLPFYYPDQHIGIKTCYLTEVDCILDRRISLSEEEIPISNICKDCLPQCNDILYKTDIEDIEIDDVGFDSTITRGLDLRNISLIYVFFGDVSYIEYRQENVLSWDSLLASFGGIFGLCLGGSVISVIELVYLLVREFLKNRRTRVQSRKSLPPASKMFLAIPAEEFQPRKPRYHREPIDKRVFVRWYEPTNVQRRKATNFEDIRLNRTKF